MAIKLHDSMFVHPGVWMRTELIDAHDLKAVDAAARLGVTRQALSAVLNGRFAVTPEMAIRVQKVFGLDPETLLRMQTAYDLAQVRARRRDHGRRADRGVNRPDAVTRLADRAR